MTPELVAMLWGLLAVAAVQIWVTGWRDRNRRHYGIKARALKIEEKRFEVWSQHVQSRVSQGKVADVVQLRPKKSQNVPPHVVELIEKAKSLKGEERAAFLKKHGIAEVEV